MKKTEDQGGLRRPRSRGFYVAVVTAICFAGAIACQTAGVREPGGAKPIASASLSPAIGQGRAEKPSESASLKRTGPGGGVHSVTGSVDGNSREGKAGGLHYVMVNAHGAQRLLQGGVRATEFARQGRLVETLPAVVVLHGLGDRPEHFLEFFAGFNRKVTWIAFRAPKPYGRGFSWFEYAARSRDNVVAEGIASAAARLAGAIVELQDSGVVKGRVIVTGFSQGGMLSFALAVRHPEQIRAAFPVGGWLPSALWPSQKPQRVFQLTALHGEADGVVPFARTKRAVAVLSAQGFTAELIGYPGVAHSMTGSMRARLFALLGGAVDRGGESGVDLPGG